MADVNTACRQSAYEGFDFSARRLVEQQRCYEARIEIMQNLAAFVADGANDGNAILRPSRQLGTESGARGERALGLVHCREAHNGLAVTRDQNFFAILGVVDQFTKPGFGRGKVYDSHDRVF